MILYTDIDPACCAVLEARVADGSLPPGDVVCADVRDLTAETFARYVQVHLFCGIGGSPLGLAWAGWRPEWPIVTGGFPCQDISSAGKAAGLDGMRSGLYREMLRGIDAKRPPLFLGENVGALSARGLHRLEREVGELGYRLGAFRVGAWAVGSPQERERWWLVGHRVGDARGPVADLPARGRGEGAGVAGDQAGGELADVRGDGRGAVGQRRPGPEPDQRGAGGGLDQPQRAGLEGHWADAGEPQVTQPGHAGDPRQWPHPRWEAFDAKEQRWLTVPTPQHEWEPPRLFPGTRTISARWRLGLMGYPLGWLDVDAAALARLKPEYADKPVKLARWWNKQGVAMTGNAQVPQCVAAIAAGLVEATQAGLLETSR